MMLDIAGVHAHGGTVEMATILETVFSEIELPNNI